MHREELLFLNQSTTECTIITYSSGITQTTLSIGAAAAGSRLQLATIVVRLLAGVLLFYCINHRAQRLKHINSISKQL